MAKNWPHSHICETANGKVLVGFSVKHFGSIPTFFVCFRSLDGRRLKRDTNQIRQAQAIEAAKLIIDKEYAPPSPSADRVTWQEAIDKLKARLAVAGTRESTLGYYLKLIRLVKGSYHGPADITPGLAEAWRDKIMTTVNRRGKLPSAHYVTSLLGGLSALWEKWFVEELSIVQGNPWQDVTPPKADKLPVKFATDEQIEHFYQWIGERFGEWPFPKLFLSAKAYTACRLMDLCGLKSGQLRDGRLVFPADLTKGRKERAVPLPADLFGSLDAFKGDVWLWANYLPGLKAAIKAKGWPTHQLNMEFAPQRLYYWVETLFADYRTANTDKPVLTTHMFRKRAFTKAWQAGVDPRRAAIAYGCNVDTLMEHYVLMDEQAVTDEVFQQMNRGKNA